MLDSENLEIVGEGVLWWGVVGGVILSPQGVEAVGMGSDPRPPGAAGYGRVF